MPIEQSKPCKQPAQGCSECLKILQAYIDGETTPEQNIMVQHCLEICGVCKECYELDKTLIETIRYKIDKPHVPMDLAQCIQDRLKIAYQSYTL